MVHLREGQPIFMEREDRCFTGKAFNKILSEMTACMTDNTDSVVRSHSFRAGVATEMAQLGCSETEIQAQGRWSSKAFECYIKKDRLKRLEFSEKLKSMVMT